MTRLAYDNLDDFYNEVSNENRIIIVNDLSYYDKDVLENLQDYLSVVYDSESLIDTAAKCTCGNFSGDWLIGEYCPKCGTKVHAPYDNVDPNVWLRSLEPDLKFMSPHFYLIFNRLISKGKFDLVRWLGDTTYNPPKQIERYYRDLEEVIGGRGYRNLINNIDKVLEKCLSFPVLRKKTPDIVSLLNQYKEEKYTVFSNMLPIPNKNLFVVEKTTSGNFLNLILSDVMSVVLKFMKASTDNVSDRKKENVTMQVVAGLGSDVFEDIYTIYLDKKRGMFRKHLYGSRSHFTFRNVITPIIGPHEYDELHLPYCDGIALFRPHIMNILINRLGYNYKEANKMHFGSFNSFNPILYDILKTLIRESPYKGIPVTFTRNPSLKQGSTQRFFVTLIKDDIYDNTVGISNKILAAPNGDFDGDEMNGYLLVDNFMADLASNLDPHFAISDLNSTYSVPGTFKVQSPTASLIANYLRKE